MSALSAADGLRLLADHLDTHPELNEAEMGVMLFAWTKPHLVPPFLAGAGEDVKVERGRLTRSFGPVKAQMSVLDNVTAAPAPPAPKLRTLAEILEAVS